MELYSVATGNVGPSNMASTEVKFVNGLPGMIGVHTAYGIGTLWMFDSQVAKMETVNSITKYELLEAIRFLIERVE